MKTIDFYFDFASPNVYLANRVLPAIAARHDAAINIIPCLLGGVFKATGNQAPMIAFGPIKGKLQYEMLEMQRFMTKHGVTEFRMNPHFPVNTLPLMRGLIVAQEAGDAERYIDVALAGMWENEENMGDLDVIARVLQDGGLDAASIAARTQEPAVKEKLVASTNAAVERGVFGLPAFFIGDDMFFGKERLIQIEELLAA